ncbi:iron donor protein CyaY [Acidithiobacillus sp. IBUN Pt1247-S3]|uniref:iron donor protein CyaY n=1 Tax=Acidithiobacillus sp. IBUN Pt1247-S3 TaxID=3166642 RepID=UPI0034E5DDF8
MTQSFAAAVEECLQGLLDQIEAQAPDVEADLIDSVLSLRLPDDSEIILNRQAVVEQIWLACSDGPARFDQDASGAWVDARSGQTLPAYLGKILQRRLGQTIELEA